MLASSENTSFDIENGFGVGTTQKHFRGIAFGTESDAVVHVTTLNSEESRHTTMRPTIVYESITCSDGTPGLLNDDYCDCPASGEDEWLTAACSYFQPRKKIACNKLGVSNDGRDMALNNKHVYLSRLHDGVRDCHDNKDEQLN